MWLDTFAAIVDRGARCAKRPNRRLSFLRPCGTTDLSKTEDVYASTAADLAVQQRIARLAQYAVIQHAEDTDVTQ